jgi:hypothetical protein
MTPAAEMAAPWPLNSIRFGGHGIPPYVDGIRRASKVTVCPTAIVDVDGSTRMPSLHAAAKRRRRRAVTSFRTIGDTRLHPAASIIARRCR